MLLAVGQLWLVACSDEPDRKNEYGVSRELAMLRKEQVKEVTYKLHFTIPESKSDQIDGTLGLEMMLNKTDHDLLLDFDQEASFVKHIAANGESIDVVMVANHLVIDKQYLKPDWRIYPTRERNPLKKCAVSTTLSSPCNSPDPPKRGASKQTGCTSKKGRTS